MKNLLMLALALILSASAFAQFNPATTNADGPISYKRGNLYNVNGMKISKEDGLENYFQTPEFKRSFVKGRRQYRVGLISLIAAGACWASNITLQLTTKHDNPDETTEGEDAFYGWTAVGGVVGLVVGNINFWSGRRKLKNLAEDYNYQKTNKTEITFGLQPHGVGLALTF